MRPRSVLVSLLLGSTIAAAQPDPDQPDPPPAEDPPAEAPAPPPAPPPAPEPPPPPAPTPLPPININITNNNNGNNSNTTTQTNSQANPQTNTQTTTQTQTQTQTQAAAPSATPVIIDREHHSLVQSVRVPPVSRSTSGLMIGVIGGEHDAGVRASLDLLGRGRWTIGVAATASEHEQGAVGYLAYTTKLGRLDVRAQVGIGAGTSSNGDDEDRNGFRRAATTTDADNDRDERRGAPEVSLRGEAALLIGLPLGKHLSLVGGLILTTSGGIERDDRGDRRERRDERPPVDIAGFAGLRWGF